MLVELLFGHGRQQQTANPKMCPCTLAFGDQGIGRLLNSVVEERVGALQAKDQPSAGGLQQRSVDLLF